MPHKSNKMEPEQSYWPIIVGVSTLVTVIIALAAFYFFFWKKERDNNRKSNNRYQRTSIALNTGHVHLWTYDVKGRLFSWLNYNGNMVKEYSTLALSKRYSAKDFENLRDELEALVLGKKNTASVVLRAKDDDTEERDYVVNMMPAVFDEEGQSTLIVGTEMDITDSKARQMAAKDMMLRYKSVFNIAMTDMALYDANGFLVDFNNKVCETFNGTRESILEQRLNLSRLL